MEQAFSFGERDSLGPVVVFVSEQYRVADAWIAEWRVLMLVVVLLQLAAVMVFEALPIATGIVAPFITILLTNKLVFMEDHRRYRCADLLREIEHGPRESD
jgi:hypothetical protein